MNRPSRHRDPRRLKTRLRGPILNLVLLVFSTAVALALGEVVARLADPGGGNVGGGQTLYEHDSVLGWKKRPEATVTVSDPEYEITETTNSLGLRGREVDRQKADGITRILLLGDSFVEGLAVEEDEVVSQVLERRIRETGKRGGVEVLNAGTAGYSTDQELLYFTREGVALEPDFTVLFVYVNDILLNTSPDYWRGSKPYFLLSDQRLLLRGVPVPSPEPDRFTFEVRGGTGFTWWTRRADAWIAPRSALYRLFRTGVTDTPFLSGIAIRTGLAEVPIEFRAWART